jgi:N-acetylglucosamine kinase-like BadF-type ATPase
MLDCNLDTANSILYLRPKDALAKEDFAQLAKTVDPHIEKTGDLAGIILEAAKFPGWDSVGALAAHLRFVREHHKRVKKIAIVTDSAMGKAGEKLASHFVAAEIRHFPAGQADAAKQWVMKG